MPKFYNSSNQRVFWVLACSFGSLVHSQFLLLRPAIIELATIAETEYKLS